MRKVTVWKMGERYAQTVLTFRITYVQFIYLNYKFRQENYVLLEYDRVAETCRSVLNVFM